MTPPLTDGCAALPDVVELGGRLGEPCSIYCAVWDRRAASNRVDYTAVDNFGFVRGEMVVFLADSASLSAGCSPEIPTARYHWAGSGGWLSFTLEAGAPARALSVVDSYGTEGTGLYADAFLDLQHAGADAANRGLTEGGADCHMTLINPRLCRGDDGAVIAIGEQEGLPCALTGPFVEEQGSGICGGGLGPYDTVRDAVIALRNNHATGDGTCRTITRMGTTDAPEFALYASDHSAPRPPGTIGPRTSYVLQCPPPPLPPPSSPPLSPPPLPPWTIQPHW